MKVTFSVEDTPDGGLVLLMDPPASELMERALAGHSTMATAAALTMFQRFLEQMLQLHGEERVDAGETPAQVH